MYLQVECYNNLTGTWTEVSPMQSRRCRLGAAALNGRLYAAGNYISHVYLVMRILLSLKTFCTEPQTLVIGVNKRRQEVLLDSQYCRNQIIGFCTKCVAPCYNVTGCYLYKNDSVIEEF